MSGGGGDKTSNKPPKELRGAFRGLGTGTEQTTDLINRRGTYAGRNVDYRTRDLNNLLGAIGGNTGLDNGQLNTTFATGGFTPFTADDQRAFSLARGLSGSDPGIQEAINLYRSNAGIGALDATNVFKQQDTALNALRNYDPRALQGLTFDQLEATARGDFLDVANNPFLSEALGNAQRQTTEAFQRDVQPALAAQFGGGFGLTGSSSINAQRRAAEDLSRALSEQATSTYAGQYNIERQLQEQAAGQLGQLGLGRATNLDQLNFNRASELGNLGLGFTNAEISRGSSLADAQLQQAQGIGQAGEARRLQELQRIGLLNDIGAQQRQSALDFYNARQNLYNAPINDRIGQLQGISSIINGTPFGTQTSGGSGSRASGIVGGAASGAALGATVGSAVPGVGTVYGGLIGGIGGGIIGAF